MRLGDGWRLTPHRAAVHVPTATAVVADLHLGYAEARRAGGEALPAALPGPMRLRLDDLFRRFSLKRLIVAGDLVERGRLGQAAAAEFARACARQGVELHLVAGNHDRGLAAPPGLVAHGQDLEWAGARIVHFDDEPTERLTFMGHLHPALRDRRRIGEAVCYLRLGQRLILPAQSDDASGMNVLAAKALADAECYAIVEDAVLDLGRLRALKARLHGPKPPAARLEGLSVP